MIMDTRTSLVKDNINRFVDTKASEVKDTQLQIC